LAREVENTDARMVGAHFDGMTFGRLVSDGGTRRWQPD
jgi:hypothetical protein